MDVSTGGTAIFFLGAELSCEVFTGEHLLLSGLLMPDSYPVCPLARYQSYAGVLKQFCA